MMKYCSRTVGLAVLVAVSGCSGGEEQVRPIEQGLCQNEDPADPCCPGSPILLDLNGDGFHLTDLVGGSISISTRMATPNRSPGPLPGQMTLGLLSIATATAS